MRALPEKKYFKIGEVADLVGVEPHVLRYWETQFPQVRPHKARSGHRLYRRREVETLLVIRELLHVQRFTIAGARQALRQPGGAQSLLPRFFDAGAAASAGAGAEQGARDTLAPTTLVPHALDATDEDIGTDSEMFDAPGADSAEGDLVEMEAQGLEEDELRDALEREAAESVRAPRGTRREVAEVEVAAEEPRRSLTSVSGSSASASAAAAESRAIERRPVAMAMAPSAVLRPRATDGARRRLLEDALKSAHSVLAVLDREDARDRAQA